MKEPKRGTQPQRSRTTGPKGAGTTSGNAAPVPAAHKNQARMKPVSNFSRRGRGDGGVKKGHGHTAFEGVRTGMSDGGVPEGTKTYRP